MSIVFKFPDLIQEVSVPVVNVYRIKRIRQTITDEDIKLFDSGNILLSSATLHIHVVAYNVTRQRKTNDRTAEVYIPILLCKYNSMITVSAK